jgi:hypothetical protein
MRNKDVIYVSNATSVEATKWMTFFRTVNGTINDPIQTAISRLYIEEPGQRIRDHHHDANRDAYRDPGGRDAVARAGLASLHVVHAPPTAPRMDRIRA